MWQFDAMVISDLHLAWNSRTSEILRFLEKNRTDRLIIAGDLFESPTLHGLRPQDIAVLESLRAKLHRARIEWLRGNHDPPADWYRGLLDVAAVDEADGRVAPLGPSGPATLNSADCSWSASAAGG